MNPYFKSTKGYNAEVVVAKPIQYTAQPSLEAFVASAVEGELGIFNAISNTLVASANFISAPAIPTAISYAVGGNLANVPFFFKVTAINAGGETTPSPELSVAAAGGAGTNSISLTWPLVAGATKYRVYYGLTTNAQDKFYEVQDNSFEFLSATGTTGSVPAANTAKTSVSTVVSGSVIYVAQKRDGAIHKTTSFKLVSGVASYTPYAAPVKTKFTIDSSVLPVPVKGNVYEIAIVELTKQGGKYHVWNFDETAKAGDTVATIVARLAARISDLNAKENYAYGKIANATVVADDLVIESVDADRYFRVIVRQTLGDAAVIHTTKPLFGSGTYDGIAQVEAEGHVFDGVTTNYPNQNITSAEFGEATKFAVRGTNYDVVLITAEAEESSPLPMHKHTHKKYIFLALPIGAATPLEEVKFIFGIV